MIIKFDKNVPISSIPSIMEDILKDEEAESFGKITIYVGVYKKGVLEMNRHKLEYKKVEDE